METKKEEETRAIQKDHFKLPPRIMNSCKSSNQMTFDRGFTYWYCGFVDGYYIRGVRFLYFIYFWSFGIWHMFSSLLLKSGEAQGDKFQGYTHRGLYSRISCSNISLYSHWGILAYQFLFQNHPT